MPTKVEDKKQSKRDLELRQHQWNINRGVETLIDGHNRLGVHCLFSPDPNKDYHKHPLNFTRFEKSYCLLRRHTNSHRHWWCSLNTFRHWKHNAQSVVGLNAIWVDVDCMKNGVSKSTFEKDFNNLVKKHQMLEPTWITDSGHGVYIVYLFKRQAIVNNPCMIGLWRQLENHLINQLNKLCLRLYGKKLGDCKSTDPSRLLRVPGTWNIKSHLNDVDHKLKPVPCNVISFNPNSQYSMSELIKMWLPEVHYKTPKKAKIKLKKKRFHEIGKGVAHARSSDATYNLNFYRAKDLLTWLKYKRYRIHGYREEFLFMYARFSIYCQYPSETIADLYRLNNKLTEPLSKYEVDNLKIEITHHNIKKYRFNSKEIIKFFDISLDCQKHLKTIISKQEKYRRRNIKRNHKSRLKRSRQNHQILKLRRQGLSYRKIAGNVNRSVGYVHKVVNS